MARAISTNLKRAFFEESTSEGLLPLLKVSWNDPVGSGTLRFVRNTEKVTRNEGGPVDYIPLMFDLELPIEDAEENPKLRLVIDNVDRQIIQEIRRLSTSPTVTIMLVTLSDPTQDPPELTLTGKWRILSYDMHILQVDIEILTDIINEPFPGHRFRRSDGFFTLR